MYETIFSIVNTSVLPAWALLVLAPRWRWTQTVAVTVTVLVLAGAYTGLLGYSLISGEGAEGVDFTTLDGVAAIFSHPLGILAGWTHYLAFDLFVGAWVVRDAQARGVRHLFVVPAIVLCFLAGPAGYLVYRATRRLAAAPR